jgi:hypothetical protein
MGRSAIWHIKGGWRRSPSNSSQRWDQGETLQAAKREVASQDVECIDPFHEMVSMTKSRYLRSRVR